MKKSPANFRLTAVCAVLFFGTLVLFSRALKNGFLDMDDPDYVTQNLHVQSGFTLENMRWAFTSTDAGNWHPLTWLSHILDWRLFGDNPQGHHATSIFLQALNSVLAFLALRKLTGAFWTSAIFGALFAWHPLRVESVAWIAERKDVLSGFFFFLTLLCYARFVEDIKVQSPRSKVFYGLTFFFFVCGLMSKPMLVTLPFLLLLLDFWPLKRIAISKFQISRTLPLFLEKIPFLAFSAASCAITFSAQKNGGAIAGNFSFQERIFNAAVSIADYIGKFFWPFDLAIVYPLPERQPLATVAGAAILIFIFTVAALWQWRRRPWLLVGWFWFLGMLAPVLGFVQVGLQAMADRYTYLPMLGFEIALLWTLREIKFPAVRRLAPVVVTIVLTGCAARTWNQMQFWKNSRSLYEHALTVTKNNYLAESNLGTTLFNDGKFAGAESHFRRAIETKPDFATARFKLAVTLEELNHPGDALAAYENFLKLRPRDALAHYNAGVLLLNRNEAASAAAHFQATVEIRNDDAAAFVGLALAKMNLNQTNEAIGDLQHALKLDPHFPGAAETLLQLQKSKQKQTE